MGYILNLSAYGLTWSLPQAMAIRKVNAQPHLGMVTSAFSCFTNPLFHQSTNPPFNRSDYSCRFSMRRIKSVQSAVQETVEGKQCGKHLGQFFYQMIIKKFIVV